jgi:hypothetical protein
MTIRAVLRPANLEAVPMETILEIRRRYAHELLALHRHVHELGEELQTAADASTPEIAARHASTIYKSTTEPQLVELKRALRGLGVETGFGLLTLKADASVIAGSASGIALGTLLCQPLLGAAAGASRKRTGQVAGRLPLQHRA